MRVGRIDPISGIHIVQSLLTVRKVASSTDKGFSKVYQRALDKVKSSSIVEPVDSVGIYGVLAPDDNVTKNYELFENSLNKIAESFGNKAAFYDASGNTGKYDYSFFVDAKV